MDPTVTMGMPVYNEEKNVAEAIESLLAQTYRNFVLIISDNASTDKTGEICKKYAQTDKRIVYVRQEKNIGSLLNFKVPVDMATTPFFMWCSGNDKWDPTFIEKLLPALENKDIVLSYPEAAVIYPDGTFSEPYEDNNTTSQIDDPVKRYLNFLWHSRIRISNMFYGIWRTESLKRCSLDLLVVAPDIIILHEAALEGKFKMYKEVLFWMKKTNVQVIKNRKQKILKQFSHLTGRPIGKETPVSITVSLIWAIVTIPFNRRYTLRVITRLWLSLNAIFVVLFGFFVEPFMNKVFKKILPQNYYSKLKSIWKK